MKNNVTILLIIMLAFLLSCSKDKPSSPSGPDYKLVESATVGPAGGTFGNEDFSLVVPAGAFSSDADLKLYETSEEQPYDEYGVSNTFRLEGLPADYSQSLEVRIKYRGTLTEESFVAAGEKVLYGDAGEEGFLFSHYPAADSLGYLVSQLPSPEDASGSFSGGHSLYGSHINAVDATTLHLVGVTDHRRGITRPGGHFIIDYPNTYHDVVIQIGAYLEDAYDSCLAVGFSYPAIKKWPQSVLVRVLHHTGFHARFCPYHLQDIHMFRSQMEKIEFNGRLVLVGELPNLRLAAGRTFFALALYMHHPQYPKVKVMRQLKEEWLNYAVMLWAEQKFTDTPNHVPDDFQRFDDHKMEPFRGMHHEFGTGEILGTYTHGWGMSPVVWYLTDRFGEQILVTTYQDISAGKHPVDAIIDAIDEYPNQWWPEFFRRYVGGEIYGVGSDIFTHSNNIIDTFNTRTTTSESFPGYYQDLSAKIYRVDLDTTGMASDARLSFQLSHPEIDADDLKVILFTMKDGALNYFTQGEGVLVPNVKDLAEQGYDLLVVAVNSSFRSPDYTRLSTITLEIGFEEQEHDYNRCSVYANVIGHSENSDGDTWEGETLNEWHARGSYSDNTFTGSLISEIHGSAAIGGISATVDPAAQKISDLGASFSVTSFGITYTENLDAEDIPLYGPLEGFPGLEYEARGPSTEDYITYFEDRVVYTGGWWSGIINEYHCDNGSYLTVQLYHVDE